MEAMNANSIELTENDVLVFGSTTARSRLAPPSAGTKRLWEILKENFEAQCNADQAERRNIERNIIEQLKNELPSDTRFLRFDKNASSSGSENESYRLMTYDELTKALAQKFSKMREIRRRREKRATKANNLFTENDVVFGAFTPIGYTAGTNRLRKILKENFEAHLNADQDERRNIEWDIVVQLKKDLPSGTRLLRSLPAKGSKQQSYRLLDDGEVRTALSEAFKSMRSDKKKREKKAAENINSATLYPSSAPRLAIASGPGEQNNDFTSATKETTITSNKRAADSITLGSHKKARVSLPKPPESSEIEIISIEEEPVEPNEELESPSDTVAGMNSTEQSDVSLKEENNELREEIEDLKEEMEQLRQCHALEVGFLQGGGSGDTCEEVTNLKEELAKARQMIKDLQGPTSESAELKQKLVEVKEELDTVRNGNRDLSSTIERLDNKNIKLKRKIVAFRQKTAAFQNQIAELKQQKVALTCQLQAEDILSQLSDESF